MLGIAAAALDVAGKVWPYVLSALVGAVIAGWLGYETGHASGYSAGRKVGYEQALADVREQDNRAAEAGAAGRAAVERCRADGGMRWEQSTGQCVRR